jgi:hypothetical protein
VRKREKEGRKRDKKKKTNWKSIMSIGRVLISPVWMKKAYRLLTPYAIYFIYVYTNIYIKKNKKKKNYDNILQLLKDIPLPSSIMKKIQV